MVSPFVHSPIMHIMNSDIVSVTLNKSCLGMTVYTEEEYNEEGGT